MGSNCTLRVAVWPGVKVSGGVTPDTVNPVPAIVTELTVTDEPPDEVKVTDCVAGEFKGTSPNDMLVAFMLRTGLLVLSCKVTLLEMPPAVAVNMAL